MLDFIVSDTGRIVIGVLGGALGAGLAVYAGKRFNWSSNVSTIAIAVAATLLATMMPRVVTHYAQQAKITASVDQSIHVLTDLYDKTGELDSVARGEVLIDAGRKSADATLQTLDAKDKSLYAAREFWAFYFTVTIARPAYCARLVGVSLDAFVNEVKRLNKLDADAAALVENAQEAEALFRTYELEKSIPMIETGDQSFANHHQVSTQVICQAYVDEPLVVASDFKFAEHLPQLSAILRAVRP